MDAITQRTDRLREVQRIFEEYGFSNAELLMDWNGEELEELAEFLTEEEFQTLLDELEETDPSRPD